MLDLAPADPQSHIVLAAVLTQLGRTSEAIGVARRAIELVRDAETHSALADALAAERRYKEAEACNQTALDLDPTHRKALINLSKIYIDSGEVTKAELMTRRTLTHYPTAPVARNNLLFAMNYSDDRTAEEVFQAYRDYDTDLCVPLRSSWKPHANKRDPARKLKVGYVSPDFRQHSGNYFIEPVFAHHDRERFEATAYAELVAEDATHATPEGLFRPLGAHGADRRATGRTHPRRRHRHPDRRRRPHRRQPPGRVRAQAGAGLADLAGLRLHHRAVGDRLHHDRRRHAARGLRTPVLGKALAPAQGNFIYRPGGGMGDPGPLPALKNGYVTLGTLTHPRSMNDRTVKVWIEILRRACRGRTRWSTAPATATARCASS